MVNSFYVKEHKLEIGIHNSNHPQSKRSRCSSQRQLTLIAGGINILCMGKICKTAARAQKLQQSSDCNKSAKSISNLLEGKRRFLSGANLSTSCLPLAGQEYHSKCYTLQWILEEMVGQKQSFVNNSRLPRMPTSSSSKSGLFLAICTLGNGSLCIW